MQPRITVLMPVYNGEAYLAESLDSVLCQTFGDFELLVVDDCSTDNTQKVLATYQSSDSRLRVVELPANRGVAIALNAGLACAVGEYVARADADDIQQPERLQRQVDFLDSHPVIGLVGARCGVIGGYGRQTLTRLERSYRSLPTTDGDIRRLLRADNQFVHSAVMFRRALSASLTPVYDPRYRCEDYELWVRMATRTRLANLPDILVYRREHEASVTRRWTRRRAYWERFRVQARAARMLGPSALGLLGMSRSLLQILHYGALDVVQARAVRRD